MLFESDEIKKTTNYAFFSAFRYSSHNRANLKTACESIRKKMLVPTRVGGTRWLPHTEGFETVDHWI